MTRSWFSKSRWLLLGIVPLGVAAFGGCDSSGRSRHLDEPNVLHGNGGSGGNGSSGQGGEPGTRDPDAGTGGTHLGDEGDASYQIGTDWDGNTTPTANHALGIDAAAGEEERGTADPTDAGYDGG
jgi:hypothetical protein